MTDKANLDSASRFNAALLARPRPNLGARIETVVSLPSRPPEPFADDRKPAPRTADWSSALELVEEASQAIRISEERATELEAELEHVMNRAAEEMRRLNADLTASELKAARSEERLHAAEARASEAEAWLVRLHQAIHGAFGPLQAKRAADKTLLGRPAPRGGEAAAE